MSNKVFIYEAPPIFMSDCFQKTPFPSKEANTTFFLLTGNTHNKRKSKLNRLAFLFLISIYLISLVSNYLCYSSTRIGISTLKRVDDILGV